MASPRPSWPRGGHVCSSAWVVWFLQFSRCCSSPLDALSTSCGHVQHGEECNRAVEEEAEEQAFLQTFRPRESWSSAARAESLHQRKSSEKPEQALRRAEDFPSGAESNAGPEAESKLKQQLQQQQPEAKLSRQQPEVRGPAEQELVRDSGGARREDRSWQEKDQAKGQATGQGAEDTGKRDQRKSDEAQVKARIEHFPGSLGVSEMAKAGAKVLGLSSLAVSIVLLTRLCLARQRSAGATASAAVQLGDEGAQEGRPEGTTGLQPGLQGPALRSNREYEDKDPGRGMCGPLGLQDQTLAGCAEAEESESAEAALSLPRLPQVGSSFLVPLEQVARCPEQLRLSLDIPVTPAVWPMHARFSRPQLGPWKRLELTVDIIDAAGLSPLLSCSRQQGLGTSCGGCGGSGGTGGPEDGEGMLGWPQPQAQGSSSSASWLEVRNGGGLPVALLLPEEASQSGEAGHGQSAKAGSGPWLLWTVQRPGQQPWELRWNPKHRWASVHCRGRHVAVATPHSEHGDHPKLAEEQLQIHTLQDTSSPESVLLLMVILAALVL